MSAALQVYDAWVEVPGGQVWTRSWCPPDSQGAAWVLLHDSLGSVEQWRGFPQALAQHTGRRVVAYDRLGFGQSSVRHTPAQHDFIDVEAQQVLPALTQALGLPRYVLLGHSAGGGMALRAAAEPGSGCVAVVTLAGQAFIEERTLEGIRTAQRAFEDSAQFARLARWHGERARWVLDAWTQVWLSPAFRHWSLGEHLGRITCPVLALHGDADEYGSSACPRAIVEGVGGPAQMALLADSGPLFDVPRNATPEQRQRLIELADEIVRTSRQADRGATAEAELDFNTLLLRATANELFAGFSGMVRLVQRLDPKVSVEPGLVWAERYRRIVRMEEYMVAGRFAVDGPRAVIGSELANDLALGGHRITLLDTATEPLARWHDQQAGPQLLDAWKDLSIRFEGGLQVEQVERVGSRYRITTTSGQRFAADEVVVAAGLVPAQRLAQSAGLDWAQGIAVDADTLQTSVPRIHALGDCISIDGQCSRYIEPIARQARTLAAAILGQPSAPYEHRAAVVRVKTTSRPLTLH